MCKKRFGFKRMLALIGYVRSLKKEIHLQSIMRIS